MKYLITGGCGFLGTNLALEVLRRGDELTVFDNLSRGGTTENLLWLREQGPFTFVHGDIRQYQDVERAVRQMTPDVIFHLAGQVAMTTSIADPYLDFSTNVNGGLNVLEAVRRFAPQTVVTYSSTNKVYGDLEYVDYEEVATRYKAVGYNHGFDEKVGLDFRSPYGCSKGATDQYMLDYHRVYGLNTIVFRHSSIFGGRQFSTYDQGWIGWFISKALEAGQGREQVPFTISGTGKQVRDVLFASDLVDVYFNAVENATRSAGEAYNIGGGPDNSLSLLELFAFLEDELSVKMHYTQLPWRKSDQKVFIADIRKAETHLGWKPRIDKATGLRRMIEWVGSRD